MLSQVNRDLPGFTLDDCVICVHGGGVVHSGQSGEIVLIIIKRRIPKHTFLILQPVSHILVGPLSSY